MQLPATTASDLALLEHAPPTCDADHDTIVCRCLGVTEGDVIKLIESGDVTSVRDFSSRCGAGAGCTACHAQLRAYLAGYRQVADANRC